MHAKVRVAGIVQGVGFRPFIYRIAYKNGLKGYVRNCGDATVEIVVEGSKSSIKSFLNDLKTTAPPMARIDKVTVDYSDLKVKFDSFRIIKSSREVSASSSTIPPDIAICDECVREMRDRKDRRYSYFFITCVNCGPRYTIIERLPYDRENTTMKEFQMCPQCGREFRDPADRRFHAQTIACPECGPKLYLIDNEDSPVEADNPAVEAGKLIGEGYIVLVKGNGGFHIACSTLNSEPIIKLRRTKPRRQKPFAVMARDLDAVKSFAHISRYEAEMLLSPVRPIVLLRKRSDCLLSDEVAPGLHNIGVMLPYTGLHLMLFDEVEEPAFIMTSANPSGEPIVKENEEAFKRFKSVADYFLMHNRKIAMRCDDSVLRMHSGEPRIIRRSRGYAPEPIRLPFSIDRGILALGSELNNTVCVAYGDRAYISQHVGDLETARTIQFLRDTVENMLRLTNITVEAIACDLHPAFNSVKVAEELAEEMDVPLIRIQHHQAHVMSLAAEAGVEEIVGVCCDGFGYGLDGKAWGGEIIYINKSSVERLAHLEEQPMVGGDLAAKYPLRMVAGILHGVSEVQSWLRERSDFLPHGVKELEIIMRQLEKKLYIQTTSCGRVLDAISALLDICYERTYEGEPAMKLESAAIMGKGKLWIEPEIEQSTLLTRNLLTEIFESLGKYSIHDLAYSAQNYVAEGLAELALMIAEEFDVENVGFTGGVAYNEHISSVIKRKVEGAGLKFISHKAIPPGDGGVSFGQVAYTARFGL